LQKSGRSGASHGARVADRGEHTGQNHVCFGIASMTSLANSRSFQMKSLSRLATAVTIFVSMPVGALLAQSTPNTGTDAATTPAPAPAPAAALPATSTTATPSATTTAEKAKPAEKKRTAKMTRQQEIDKSIESGTVPSRYRRSVPKEYQQYVPFAK